MGTTDPRRAVVARLTPAHRYAVRRVPVSGGRLTYAAWEPGDAPSPDHGPDAVIALHGLTGNHRCWPLVVGRLPGVRVLAPDLRGRGASSDLEGPSSMRRHAEDVLALMDHAGVRRAVLLGHSMGGFISLVAARIAPERFTALTLVDGGLPTGWAKDRASFNQRVVAPVAARLAVTHPSTADALRSWRAHPAFLRAWSPVAEEYARYDLRGEVPFLRPRAAYESVIADIDDIYDGRTLADAIRGLAHPAQFLSAARGLLDEVPPMYPADSVMRWRERLPHIEYRPVGGVNHYTIVMSPEGAEAICWAVRAALEGREVARAKHRARRALHS